MERAAWTDERLDDLARRMDAGFERVDTRLNSLDAGLNARIDGLDARLSGRIESLDARLSGRLDGLDARLDALNVTLVRLGGGAIVGLVGLIAAVLVRG